MLSLSLGLPEFKVIKHDQFADYHLISVEKNSWEERCIHCGFLSSSVHDRRTRKVRDLPILNEEVYLLIHVKRYKCPNCLEVFSERYESVLPRKHQTNRLREYLYQLCLGTTIEYVSSKMNIPYTTLERIFYSVAEEEEAKHQETLSAMMDPDHLVLSLDEVAVCKGHQYETVLLDAQLGSVLGMIHQRTTESTKQLLHQHVLSKEAVQTVVMDMWEPFHKAVKSMFPWATIVVDKYHVIQKVTQALDQVRKKHPKLKRVRYLFLKGYEKLTDQQKMKLDELLGEHSDLACAYYLKEKLRDFYQIQDYDDALCALEEWIQLAWSSPFPSFHGVAKTLEKWKAEILQYFFCPYTNGKTEGTNHKIKNIKRRAYGYRNLARFRQRVFLECTGDTSKHHAA